MVTPSTRAELDVDFQKYWLVLRRQWLPAAGVFGVVTLLTTLFALSREPMYQAAGKVLVKIDRTPSLTGVDTSGQNTVGRPNAIGTDTDPIATQVESISALPIAEAAIAALDLQTETGQPLGPVSFLKALDVRPIAGTDMIRITYQDQDPEQAAAVVNKVIEVYRARSIEANQDDAIAAREFLTRQLPASEAAVRQADAALRNFKERNQVIVLDVESEETVKAMKRLDDSITLARSQLVTATARSRELQRRLGMRPEQAVNATALSQSPAVQEVFTQLRQVQGQLDLQRARYQPIHPEIQKLLRQEANLQARLQDSIGRLVSSPSTLTPRNLQMGALEQQLTSNLVQAEVDRISLTNQVAELTALQAAQRRRASVFPRLEATQRDLERRLAAAQSTYESLLQRLQEVRVAEDQRIDNVRIVSPALAPEDSMASNKSIVLAGGLLLGSVLGLLTAFALDLCDRSIKTVREAGELLDYPILGVIPSWKKLGRRREVPQVFKGGDAKSGYMSHAYHLLQANLRFHSSGFEPRVIVVTSSIPSEGKSQVAANLAMAMAQAGSKVLLVDADLHQPIQHQIWEGSNHLGLVQILEQKTDLSTAVQNLPPNLALLSAGTSSSESLAMFNTRHLAHFIESAAKAYDVVILDTASLSWAADASILGKMADGTLLVVRPHFAEVNDVKAAKGLLGLSGQTVLGIVVNGVAKTDKPSRYFADIKEPSPVQSRSQMVMFKNPTGVERGMRVKLGQRRRS